MFVRAIDVTAQFTRAIHSIERYFGSPDVFPGAASMFFVNADGWALTCRHVAQQIVGADQLLQKFTDFKNQRTALSGKKDARRLIRALEKTFGFNSTTVVELYNNFMGCVEGKLQADLKWHATLDLALIQFHGYDRLLCNTFPVFADAHDDLKQGKVLCRLGFPFPEFNNFEYDGVADHIRWTSVGRIDTPRFPVEGMVTRHLLDQGGGIMGFEMSTPGLRGQSGGPAFDTEGRVWGMQSATNHLDLNFDVDMKVRRNGQEVRMKHHAVMHVGHCIHVRAIKEFMTANGVSFRAG